MPPALKDTKRPKKTGVWGGYNARQIAELVDMPFNHVRYRLDLWRRQNGRHPFTQETGKIIAALVLEKTSPGEVAHYVQV